MTRFENIISSLALKIRRALQRHGIIGLLVLSAERIAWLAIRLLPSVRHEIQEREQRAGAFDKQFGVDTAGCIHQTALNVNNPNQLRAVYYKGSDPKLFREAIVALPIDYRRFVFIDFGSGKGRAILLATEFPFNRIIGVKFSDELHMIAQDNIRRFHSVISKCNKVKSVCTDAVAYPLPDDCLVCYFYNPFDATIMSQVLLNIRRSLLQKPREIFIVYYNPKESHIFDPADCFIRYVTRGPITIWRTMLESQLCKE